MLPNLIESLRRRRAALKAAFGRMPRKRRRLPPQQEPRLIELAYYKNIRDILFEARELVQRMVLPMLPRLVEEGRRARGDSVQRADAPKEVNAAMDDLSEQMYRNLPNAKLEEMTGRYAARTSEFQREQLDKQLRVALGVQTPFADPNLRAQMEEFVAENVALIKSIPQRYFDQVEREVLAGVRDGDRWETIAARMEERFGVAESSAKLIARDQVGKLYGELNEARQTALGIKGYVWRTSQDNRVRPEHEERNGRRYQWSDPPADGHPGEAINCRCNAEPDLEDILDQL